ncbi:hypothetical protein DICPUDRAFT_151851 [Dictyostelium purpureum]|uniref:Uncharacterized protein n=1 Tax=Dictyostelium purpureum TaxID=5786 RepID=F0ZJX3_DICPU|nr:uncharacterized protein DICPUDRAFT_151851 [Dictyostelium purpureum]EGC35768.1 hypothetical protein DICPUDRAFT_151851 [Dictyostelium purpureum]|eukprot:XP_003287720.1 hypothetical protein DICPUDRAFT_151851 [Dictyostelium purpureum]
MINFLFEREIGRSNERKERWDQINRNFHHLDLSVYRQIQTYNKGPINQMDIDVAENRYLLSVSGDGVIQIYDLYENLLNNKINENRNEEVFTNKIEFQPILNINRKNSQIQNNVNQYSNTLLKGISTCQWYPMDTGMFFTGGLDGCVDIWDTNEAMISQTFNLEYHINSISYSIINSSSLTIAAATADQKVRICDIRTNSSVHCLTGHRESVIAVKWSPYSPYLIATGSKDKTIRLWDVRRSDTFLLAFDQYNGGSDSIASSSNDSSTFSDMNENSDRNNLKQTKRYRQKLHKPNTIQSGKNSVLEKKKDQIQQYSHNQGVRREVPFAHNGTITSLAWTPDGEHIVSTGNDSKIHLWDVQKGKKVLVDYPHSHNVNKIPNQMSLSSDGKYIIHPNSRTIHVYETATGKLVRQLKGHFERVNCCVYYQYDEAIISGSNDRLILYWDTSNDDQNENIEFIKQSKKDNLEKQSSLLYNHDDSDEENNNNSNSNINNNNNNINKIISTQNPTLPDEDNWSDEEQN